VLESTAMKARHLVIALTLLAGCDSDTSSSGGAPNYFPESCLEVQEALTDAGEDLEDGEYTLYLDGSEDSPWTAYCYGMRWEEPEEYLTVDEDSNFSEASIGDSMTITRYKRLRIHPSSLEIDPLDARFTITSSVGHGDDVYPQDFTFVPLGWVQYGGPDSVDGVPANASVDVSGTAFAFADSIIEDPSFPFFCVSQSGVTEPVSNSQVEVKADLTRFVLQIDDSYTTTLTRVVADCDHMGIETVTEGRFPLQYVGE
jgi:hypothetical protein